MKLPGSLSRWQKTPNIRNSSTRSEIGGVNFFKCHKTANSHTSSRSRAIPSILFVFYSAPNSGQNALFVFGQIVERKISRIRIISTAESARPQMQIIRCKVLWTRRQKLRRTYNALTTHGQWMPCCCLDYSTVVYTPIPDAPHASKLGIKFLNCVT